MKYSLVKLHWMIAHCCFSRSIISQARFLSACISILIQSWFRVRINTDLSMRARAHISSCAWRIMCTRARVRAYRNEIDTTSSFDEFLRASLWRSTRVPSTAKGSYQLTSSCAYVYVNDFCLQDYVRAYIVHMTDHVCSAYSCVLFKCGSHFNYRKFAHYSQVWSNLWIILGMHMCVIYIDFYFASFIRRKYFIINIDSCS